MALTAAGAGSASPPLRRVGREALRVEAGAVEEGGDPVVRLRHPGVRAVVPGSAGSSARLAFVYRGPSAATAPLASGELRRQVGLKLRGRDSCNVVYVMWHVEPAAGVEVQVKSNPGMSTHAECGDHGYRTLRPASAGPTAPVAEGRRHELEARVRDGELVVAADGVQVFRGPLPAAALALDGPAGLRSDNGAFDVELWADLPPPGDRR